MVAFKHIHMLILIWFCSFSIVAQQHLRSEINFDKNAVYIGEPLEVSVSIYSSTWFTDGVDPGNVKIDGAYTVYFRSLSSSKVIESKRYSGVTLFYNVFPYSDKNVTFPSLSFTVETPDEGDYVGKKRRIKTRERVIKVKPIPPNIDKDKWLVSPSMRVYDNWTGDLTKVKVGDVLERNITLKVSNTISEFIPEIDWDNIQNVSLYPKRSTLKNNKTKTNISATRIDGTRYLFEKEGTITIPEITIQWWNPRYNRLYKRVLKSKTIIVDPNPDLGMLESVKKSLAATVEKENDDDKPITLYGMSLKRFLSALVLAILGLFYVLKLGSRLYQNIKNKRKTYLESEAYYFKIFLKSIHKNNSETKQKLYNWLDLLDLREPTIKFFISEFGNSNLKEKNDNLRINKLSIGTKKEWKTARNNFLKNKNTIIKNNDTWVNQ